MSIFLVLCIISTYVVHGRMSLFNDLFVQLCSFAFRWVILEFLSKKDEWMNEWMNEWMKMLLDEAVIGVTVLL